jgi:hypothetical protein
MKTILLIVISIFTVQISIGQTGSDYYLPQCEGNYLEFYTPGGGPIPPFWEARTTIYSIIRSDIINGKLFFLEKAMEITDSNPEDTSVFHCFWLCKDSIGNIIAGAYDPTNSGDIDSAVIINPPFLWFPNQFLTVGYSRVSGGPEGETTDSVISVSATVGTYTNCIQIRETRRIAGVIDRISEEYYAYHIGKVKGEILYQPEDAHVDNLIDFTATDCYLNVTEYGFGSDKEINIYPNPTNGKFTITYPSKTKEIQILNYLGQMLQAKYVDNETSTEFELTENGIYFIRVKTDKQMLTGKLIICR